MNSSARATADLQDDISRNELAQPPAWRSLLNHPIARIMALALLLSTAAILDCVYLTALGDYDIWFHLRTGEWILQNHAFPHSGLFSQYGSRPWMAYSWGFEVLTALLYKLCGLISLPLLLAGFRVALAAITFRLARVWRENLWTAVLLSAAAQLALPNLETRPSFISMLFFGIELILLFRSRRSGQMRPLYWLPPLFLVWANLHIQFVYGVIAVVIFFAALTLERLGSRWTWITADAPSLPLSRVAGLTAICCLVPLLSPYSYHLYRIAWRYSHSAATYAYIVEMHAMNFRLPQHYVRVLLVMAAALVFGYRRSREMFSPLLLVTFALLGFRAQRDVWIAILPAVAIIAEAIPRGTGTAENLSHTWRWERLLTAALTALALLVTVWCVPHDRQSLLQKTGNVFPVRACDAIRANHLSGPIYNPLNWGGFLAWYLPEYPVAIDGRTDLYGDEILVRQYQVLNGERSPFDEPTFAGAHIFLLPRTSALAWEMSRSPRYRLVYHDERAVIFVPSQSTYSAQ